MNHILKQVRVACDNDLAALVPEWWAMEGLVTLEESLVIANVVNRDYQDYFSNYGDVVHVSKPGTFNANHKVQGSAVTVQDASATDTTVRMNQHIETTFHIDDRDAQKSIPELRALFLVPAVQSLAKKIDAALVGETPQFYTNAVGQVGTALTAPTVIQVDKRFNDNNNPEEGRMLIVGSSGKADLYGIERFTDYDKIGRPEVLLNGSIGNIMGMETFMSQSMGKNLPKRVTRTTETVSANPIIGASSCAITSAGAAHTAGTWFTIAGIPGIYRLTAAVSSTDTSMSFEPALKDTVGTTATATFYESMGEVKGAVTADGAKIKVITDGYTAVTEIPQVNSAITFGAAASAPIYTVTKVSGTWASSSSEITLELNRPLEANLADNDDINVLPEGGSYNLAMRKDAITLVNRPLAPASAGVAAATQSANGISLRVTIGYDQDYMKHKVTVDTLLGVKVLDVNQGVLLLN